MNEAAGPLHDHREDPAPGPVILQPLRGHQFVVRCRRRLDPDPISQTCLDHPLVHEPSHDEVREQVGRHSRTFEQGAQVAGVGRQRCVRRQHLQFLGESVNRGVRVRVDTKWTRHEAASRDLRPRVQIAEERPSLFQGTAPVQHRRGPDSKFVCAVVETPCLAESHSGTSDPMAARRLRRPGLGTGVGLINLAAPGRPHPASQSQSKASHHLRSRFREAECHLADRHAMDQRQHHHDPIHGWHGPAERHEFPPTAAAITELEVVTATAASIGAPGEVDGPPRKPWSPLVRTTGC